MILPDHRLHKLCLAGIADEFERLFTSEVCTWTYHPDGPGLWCDYWETGCGNEFEMVDGSPTDNDMKFCPYCGKRLEEKDE